MLGGPVKPGHDNKWGLDMTTLPASTRAVAFINVAHFADHFMMLIYATAVIAMGPMLGLSYGTGIALATGLFACFGILSLPAGWIGDRWSRRHMLAAFYLGGGASLVLTGLVTGVWQLAAALTLIGVFSAIYHPVGTAMLVSVAGPSGRIFGLNGVFGNLGVAAAPLVTGLIVEALGWRWAFALPGLVMFAFGVAFLFAVPSDAGKVAKHASATARPATALDLRFVAIVIGITVFAGGFTFNTVTIALPKFVVERSTDAGVGLAEAGFIATAIYLVGAATQIVVGRLVDRFSSGSIFLVLASLQVMGFAGMAILDGPVALATAGLVLASVYGQVVVNDLIIARSVPDRWRSRAYAMRYMLGFAVAAGVVPLISLMHTQERGYAPIFLLMAGFALMIAACAAVFAMAERARTRAVAVPAPAE